VILCQVSRNQYIPVKIEDGHHQPKANTGVHQFTETEGIVGVQKIDDPAKNKQPCQNMKHDLVAFLYSDASKRN